jgi:hypothetical protein
MEIYSFDIANVKEYQLNGFVYSKKVQTCILIHIDINVCNNTI